MEEREDGGSIKEKAEEEINPIYSEVPVDRTPITRSRSSGEAGNQYSNFNIHLEDVSLEETRSNADERSANPSGVLAGHNDVIRTYQPESPKYKNGKNNPSIDYVNRDPQKKHDEVKINFFDIIAEPEGSHSFNTIWGTSYKVYSVTKFWLYRILTLLCGIPCSLFWGIYFACLAFIGVWWVTPCIRAFSIKLNYVSKFYSIVIKTFLDPVFESLGLTLSRIQVKLTRWVD